MIEAQKDPPFGGSSLCVEWGTAKQKAVVLLVLAFTARVVA
jgi:hypothetical protein